MGMSLFWHILSNMAMEHRSRKCLQIIFLPKDSWHITSKEQIQLPNMNLSTGHSITSMPEPMPDTGSSFGNFYPLAGAGIYYGYLIRADQFFGETYYNLIAEGDIKRNDFGVNLFAGAEYEYSASGSVFFRVNEALGLMQLEKGENTTQKLYNRTFSIQLGLQFVIDVK